MKKYTVTKTQYGTTFTSEVYFDGNVYRWVSNDRVPPTDAIREYGIDQLPGFWPMEHELARDGDLEAFLRDNYPHFNPAVKKKRITIKEQAEAQIAEACRQIQSRISHLPTHPMGHAFLWGVVEVTLKNGKTRRYRTCLGSVCSDDLERVVRIANSVPGVSNVTYNLD